MLVDGYLNNRNEAHKIPNQFLNSKPVYSSVQLASTLVDVYSH